MLLAPEAPMEMGRVDEGPFTGDPVYVWIQEKPGQHVQQGCGAIGDQDLLRERSCRPASSARNSLASISG